MYNTHLCRYHPLGQEPQRSQTVCPQKTIPPLRERVPLPRTSQLGYSSYYLAKILKLVKHENIVTCFRMFKTNSNLYIVYNYQESNTLDEVLEVGPKVLTFAQSKNNIHLRVDYCQATVSGDIRAAQKFGGSPQYQPRKYLPLEEISPQFEGVYVLHGNS